MTVSDSDRQRLVTEYTRNFAATGRSPEEAHETAVEFVKQAEEKVRELGWDNGPPNEGDLYLEQEKTNPAIRESLDARRAEGVRDEDIRWLYNLPPIDRVLLEMSDQQTVTAAYIASRRGGMSKEEAATFVLRRNAKFGDPAEGQGEDRPLPIELKKRIVEYVEGYFGNLEEFARRVEQFSSFNALVREEIRAGRL